MYKWLIFNMYHYQSWRAVDPHSQTFPSLLQSEYCCSASITWTQVEEYYKDGEGLGPRLDLQFVSILLFNTADTIL